MDNDSNSASGRIPRRPYFPDSASKVGKSQVSVIGLGCSSFSCFFSENKQEPSSVETLRSDDPVVQDWIKTIHYAILDAGVTLLDTAPWYGHGLSEVVVGLALETLWKQPATSLTTLKRDDLTINTKVGRYEAEPKLQFDFSKKMTLKSARRSLQRLKVTYIDVLQLHDPEFAPSLNILLDETIPAMIQCREEGICRAIGMTGYPLAVQEQILQASLERFGENVWDHALTYAHYNLHDQTLLKSSFHAKWQGSMPILSAAPLSMGLFTKNGPPAWHPAPDSLKEACRKAVIVCNEHKVDISTLAIAFALQNESIPCTILGMKSVEQVKTMQRIANRKLSKEEQIIVDMLLDSKSGPFSGVPVQWDGVKEACMFWDELKGASYKRWQSIMEDEL